MTKGIKSQIGEIIECFLRDFGYQDVTVRVRRNAFVQNSYQTDVLFELAKNTTKTPHDLFLELFSGEEMSNYFTFSFSGNGFLNITLKSEFISKCLFEFHIEALPRNNIDVVVDYASPNVAKEMHVGHLRSAAIGCAIARILEFAGYNVIRQHHIGDWGTQFGFIIQFIIEKEIDAARLSINEMNVIYQEAKKLFDEDVAFEKRARIRLDKLQNNDAESIRIWQLLVERTTRYLSDIFGRLEVDFSAANIRGESAYREGLQEVIDELKNKNICVRDDGAELVKIEDKVEILKKSDGTYLYMTTDLAALKYRLQKAKWIIYITDSRQIDHFKHMFYIARVANWDKEVKLSHIAFGNVLGSDKRPLKTREGNNTTLSELVESACIESFAMMKGRQISNSAQIASTIGIGAMKYFDLKNDYVKDYIFHMPHILSLHGYTSVYIQNAYIRILSILKKFQQSSDSEGVDFQHLSSVTQLQFEEESEIAVALKTLEFWDTFETVLETLKPHHLCSYLYELASAFHLLYERCQILKAHPTQRDTRLYLIHIVQSAIYRSLSLLGISVVSEM
ncbi:Arginine--tRNA ligase [Candidatus Fokinia solitaria]|uniref:Arginine--tRNA ligase n=1 Tax=Candidatus Fokinia solitaria TaxID=1802984 RepID=A0A2U8BR93_9RICK|nr:arginine--tRNA ligase [Candidatus Fokinia solitaria]AWD32857.1 Arginine--tRNA ligase [Candidatus Fokinia solitaria]